jgi:hypothetical protein
MAKALASTSKAEKQTTRANIRMVLGFSSFCLLISGGHALAPLS